MKAQEFFFLTAAVRDLQKKLLTDDVTIDDVTMLHDKITELDKEIARVRLIYNNKKDKVN